MSAGLEKALCAIHEKSYCHLVGNATSGIYLALLALGLNGKVIAIPNSVCPHVPLAILLSGNIPLYLDISEEDLGLCILELKRNIHKVDAVIAVHAYGSICDVEAIASLCKLSNIPIIEDIAVAQGAKIDGRPVGSFSDIAVASFGAGKIIDCGHGGALLTNDLALLNQAIVYEASFDEFRPSAKEALNTFSSFHTNLYNKFYGEKINSYCNLFKEKALALRSKILYKFDYSYLNLIEQRLKYLDSIILSRMCKAERFREIFISSEIEIKAFTPKVGSVDWRFNFFIDNRDALLKLLLTGEFKVSSWFPSVDLFFENREISKIETNVSDRVGDRIINLWVNDDADTDYIQAVSKKIISYVGAK